MTLALRALLVLLALLFSAKLPAADARAAVPTASTEASRDEQAPVSDDASERPDVELDGELDAAVHCTPRFEAGRVLHEGAYNLILPDEPYTVPDDPPIIRASR